MDDLCLPILDRQCRYPYQRFAFGRPALISVGARGPRDPLIKAAVGNDMSRQGKLLLRQQLGKPVGPRFMILSPQQQNDAMPRPDEGCARPWPRRRRYNGCSWPGESE